MNEKLRNRLIILALLFLLVFFFMSLNSENEVFVKDKSEIENIQQKQIKKSDNIIFEPEKDGKRIELKALNSKYEVAKKSEINICSKKGYSSIVQADKDFNIVQVENGNTYSYYKEKNQNCSLIGKIKNARFTDNIVQTYANDSIYSSYESIDDFKLSGLVRIIQNNVKPVDASNIRYTNPTAYKDGVILIENHRDIQAYNTHDKIIFEQNNGPKNRSVSAINKVGDAFYVLVKEKKKMYLEAYNIKDTQSIVDIKPKLKVEVKDFVGSFQGEVSTTASNEYGSFSANGHSLIVSSTFAKLFYLDKADTVIGIDENIAYMKYSDKYFAVDLDTKEYESIGAVKIASFQIKEKNAFLRVNDDKGLEQYVKFKVR
ncbi:MAG: hypothetical protein RR543_04495 [Erysipelotrichales bacterium]